MAHVPVPGSELTGGSAAAERLVADAVPPTVLVLLKALWASGQAGYIVGGSIRDVVLGRAPVDWDLATDARPERVQGLFPGAVYENRFGTVAVRSGDERPVEIT